MAPRLLPSLSYSASTHSQNPGLFKVFKNLTHQKPLGGGQPALQRCPPNICHSPSASLGCSPSAMSLVSSSAPLSFLRVKQNLPMSTGRAAVPSPQDDWAFPDST